MSTPTVAAPSAAPTPPPASNAPAPNPLQSVEDYSRYATAALVANATPPPDPSPAPVAVPPAPAGPESPPAGEATPATPPGDTPPADPAAPAPSVTDEDDAEPTPEETAGLSEAGLRALQSERLKRKAARAEVRELSSKLKELEARITTLTTPPIIGQPAPGQPPAAPAAPAPASNAGPTALTECQTFAAVDACAKQAATTKANVERLQFTLAHKGAEQAAAELRRQGVENIHGTPVAEASDEQIAEFLISVGEGASLMQIEAPARKQFLAQQNQFIVQAAQIIPELRDPASPRSQRFHALAASYPDLRQRTPDWPLHIADKLVGEEMRSKTVAANGRPATPTPASAPTPAPRPAPGAPRVSAGVSSAPSELDQLASKMANGTATHADMARYATLNVRIAA